MSVAHTPSRYDPCTTGTDGASLGARPCGGSDVEASPRQSCAARRLSVSNPGPLTSERYALHLGPALPTEWCYRVVWWSGALELLQRRLRTARIVQRTPHQPSCLRVGIVCFGPHQPGACVRQRALSAGQERCRAKVDASAAGESPVSSLAPLVSRGSGETRGVLGEERPACLCKSTSCATAW